MNSSLFTEPFKEKFSECNLHNPLLYYLEKGGISFTGLGKISLTNTGLPSMNRHNNHRLFIKPYLSDFNYKIKYAYSEVTTLLFIAGLLEDVIKERIASDNLVSKLSEKGAMNKWLGLQDPGCREVIEAIGCDGVLPGQDGESETICTGV